MSKKLSNLTSFILPCINVLGQEVPNAPQLSRIVTKLFSELHCVPETLTNKVLVLNLSDKQLSNLRKEMSSSTLSFNIKFQDCDERACGVWDNKKHILSSERPTIPVSSGKTPGFVVYIYNGIPILSFLSYSSNFNNWAERINLRKSMNVRTSDPSTHYVYRESAEETGLLWISPIIKHGGDPKEFLKV